MFISYLNCGYDCFEDAYEWWWNLHVFFLAFVMLFHFNTIRDSMHLFELPQSFYGNNLHIKRPEHYQSKQKCPHRPHTHSWVQGGENVDGCWYIVGSSNSFHVSSPNVWGIRGVRNKTALCHLFVGNIRLAIISQVGFDFREVIETDWLELATLSWESQLIIGCRNDAIFSIFGCECYLQNICVVSQE